MGFALGILLALAGGLILVMGLKGLSFTDVIGSLGLKGSQ